jgi:hypothetical protein
VFGGLSDVGLERLLQGCLVLRAEVDHPAPAVETERDLLRVGRTIEVIGDGYRRLLRHKENDCAYRLGMLINERNWLLPYLLVPLS